MSEVEFQKASDGKELLGRRLKNWKMELNDETMASLLKKLQYKSINAFYAAIGEGILDVSDIKNHINEIQKQEIDNGKEIEQRQSRPGVQESKGNDDILVIEAKNVRGLELPDSAAQFQ